MISNCIFRISDFSAALTRGSLAALSIFLLSLAASSQIAVKGGIVWTMTGEPVANGVVLIATKRGKD